MADPEAVDQQPTSVPQSAPPRREADEISANEGSSPDGTCAQYNLRSRNADEKTHLRRQEQKRIREERNQKNLLRKQWRKARAQDVERKLKIKAMLDEQSNAYKEEQTAKVMSFKFRVRTFKGCKSEVTTQTIDVDKFTPSSSGLNRWPLPSPIIIRRYAYGELIQVERYITAD